MDTALENPGWPGAEGVKRESRQSLRQKDRAEKDMRNSCMPIRKCRTDSFCLHDHFQSRVTDDVTRLLLYTGPLIWTTTSKEKVKWNRLQILSN